MKAKAPKRIPTNVIIGFLGCGKTTAIAKLIDKRPAGEKWSILINEFGTVSIDHALVESGTDGVAVEELGGGCACCTMASVFEPLLAQFVRRTRPDRLILEPSGVSHPANVIDILRNQNFCDSIDLRNIVCLIDPEIFDDVRWRDTAVFQDQVQLADIVILNWADCRDRDLLDRCRVWVESFRPPKPLVLETSFGDIDLELLDRKLNTVRFPLFVDAHPSPDRNQATLPMLGLASKHYLTTDAGSDGHSSLGPADRQPSPEQPSSGQPLRFQNDANDFDACGWVFHVDDVFDRDELLDLLGYVHPIVRLKGVFRCEDDWWTINRAKDGTSYAPSAYRRDSRLEIILDQRTSGWDEFETKLVQCLAVRR